MKRTAFLFGLGSAALFGVATPLSKILLRDVTQFQLAGLLYLGAAAGILPFLLARRRRWDVRKLGRANILRIAGSVLFGGCLGPVFLLLGLETARSSSVSLWLNLELAATAVIGFFFFRDRLDLRGWLGVAGVLLAGVLVTVGEGISGVAPALFVAAACVCWGIDNNLTSLIDGLTPRESTFVKGVVAGTVNLVIGIVLHPVLPGAWPLAAALALGAVCYGGSIVLYITAAQGLGAARGQILFASGPFFGLLFAVALLGERPTAVQLAAVGVLAVSIAVMLRVRHAHAHRHAAVTHVHPHRHDDLHHQHAHDAASGGQPASPSAWHTHEHTHHALTHEHPHHSDIHHRHDHHAVETTEPVPPDGGERSPG